MHVAHLDFVLESVDEFCYRITKNFLTQTDSMLRQLLGDPAHDAMRPSAAPCWSSEK